MGPCKGGVPLPPPHLETHLKRFVRASRTRRERRKAFLALSSRDHHVLAMRPDGAKVPLFFDRGPIVDVVHTTPPRMPPPRARARTCALGCERLGSLAERQKRLRESSPGAPARRGQNVGDPRARLVTVTCCTALCAVHSTEVAFHKCGSETSSSLSLSLSSRHRQPAMGAAAKRFLLLAVLVAARPG